MNTLSVFLSLLVLSEVFSSSRIASIVFGRLGLVGAAFFLFGTQTGAARASQPPMPRLTAGLVGRLWSVARLILVPLITLPVVVVVRSCRAQEPWNLVVRQ